jgi:hypothetical protein
MKHNKYITTQTKLAYLSKRVPAVNIHEQIKETIVERKRILQQLEDRTRIARRIEWYINPRQAA